MWTVSSSTTECPPGAPGTTAKAPRRLATKAFAKSFDSAVTRSPQASMCVTKTRHCWTGNVYNETQKHKQRRSKEGIAYVRDAMTYLGFGMVNTVGISVERGDFSEEGQQKIHRLFLWQALARLKRERQEMFPESIVVDMRGVTASAMLGYLVRFIQHIHFALYQHRIQSISNGLVVLSAHEEMINGAAFFTLQETT